jgi:hypothetical protein
MSDDPVKLARTMAMAMDKTFHESNAANSWRAVANALEAAYAKIAELEKHNGSLRAKIDADAQWGTIETAPKDGTHILVCFGPYDRWTTFAQQPPTVAHWFGDGWYLSRCPFDHDALQPLMWRPLPPPSQNAGA